jgi:hypothetical protein
MLDVRSFPNSRANAGTPEGPLRANKRLMRGANYLVKIFRDQPAYAFSRSAMTIFCIFIMACMALSAFLRSGSLR